jgi:hypothetical protein
MDVSFSQHTDVTCPTCGTKFTAEVWLIVDVGGRPDLLERMRARTLHDITCPNGHSHTVDAPLLVYRPGKDPPVLFSPARRTTEEQDREQAGGLVGMVRERLGDAWRDEWVAQGLRGAPRDLLPAALSDDPEAAMRELAERARAEMERLRQDDPEAYGKLEQQAAKALEPAPLAQVLFEFIQAGTWDESRRIVEAHPELLTDEADALLGKLLDSAQQRNDESALRLSEEHHTLLRRCCEVGVQEAFAEKTRRPDIPEKLRPFMEALASLPGEQRNALADLMGGVHSPEELEAAINTRPELRAALQQAFGAVLPCPPGGGRERQSPPIPAALRNDVQRANEAEARYLRSGDLQALDEAVAAWKRIWDQPDFAGTDPAFRLAALNDGGGTFLRRHWARGRMEDLSTAISAYEQAVQQTPAGSPERAAILNNLGNGLRDRYARTGHLPDLEQAIQRWQDAVQQTPARSPDLPSYLNNLGNGLRDRYARTRVLADLEAAADQHEQARRLLEDRFSDSPVAYKLGQQERFAAVYADLVSIRLKMAEAAPSTAMHVQQGLEVTEATKSRVLSGLMSAGLPDPPGVSPEAVARERDLFARLCDMDSRALTERGTALGAENPQAQRERDQERAAVKTALDTLWADWELRSPDLAQFVALRRGEPPTWSDLAGLAAELGPQTALLSLSTTRREVALFLLRDGQEKPLAVTVGLDRDGQQDIWNRFHREVHAYDRTGRRGETWDAPLRPLLADAVGHLDGAQRVVLAPQTFGHLLPWAVALRRAGWRGALVTVPALGLVPRLRGKPRPAAGDVLVAGNPVPTDELNLPYAEKEARDVAAMLGTQPLIGAEATKEAVLSRLPGASIIHLATHAYFHGGSPMESGVILADGVLTAREVMAQRLNAALLVLSACQTGIAGSVGGDELAGLAQAFLYAGARSLLVSLWAVDDPATAALMTAFYGERQAGADKAEALSRAMDHTHSQPRWAHPYYWGAFVLMGDWE